MTNLDIIRVGGELYAASEGDGGRRGGKETSTVNLEDGRDENELDEYASGEQMLSKVSHLFFAFLLLQLSTPVPGFVVGLL